jgi:S1-C subfamily serine protease
MDDGSTRRRVLATIGTVASTGTAGCAGLFADSSGEETTDEEPTPVSVDASQPLASETVDGDRSVYASVYEQTIDSVVVVRGSANQGSGFVYDDQHVVTNEHVVEEAESMQIQFSGDRWETGTVVGTDTFADLAVLSVEDRPEYARPLQIATGSPAVGEEVMILGNPFGLDASLSRGIVSGVDRSLPSPAGFSIPDAIQTDASVNPGNSGGPIVDLTGEVVGVINAGQGDGIGFGISAAIVNRVIPALIEDGVFEHSYLGVRLRQVTPRIAEANDLNRAQGVIVVDALEDTPADGVLVPSEPESIDDRQTPVGGDVLVKVDDKAVFTQTDLAAYLVLQTTPGDTLSLTIVRDGKRQRIETTLVGRPAPGVAQAPV